VEVTATAWVATVALIVVLLGIDLAVGALRPHAVGFAEATVWSVWLLIWTGLQLYRHRDEDPGRTSAAFLPAPRPDRIVRTLVADELRSLPRSVPERAPQG
jgi:hypothetical protein